MTTELAVSAETIHVSLPFLERVRRVADRSLQAEIWNWSNHPDDPDELAAMNAEMVSMTGYLRGSLTDDNAIPELPAMAEESLRATERPRCPRLNLHGTKLNGRRLPMWPVGTVTGVTWARAAITLQRAATLGKYEGRIFVLESFSLAVDHPDMSFTRMEDTLALIPVVDSPGLRMNLDLYHAQIGEGDLTEFCRRALPWMGEIQVADVPGRCEPDTGKVNYSAVVAALREMGYDGTVALEAFARSDPDPAIDAFIRALIPRAE